MSERAQAREIDNASSRGIPRRAMRYRKCGSSKSLCTVDSLLSSQRPVFPIALLDFPERRVNDFPLTMVVSGDI
ncbi:hypothetical protein SAMN05445850_2291 [Paraburkholderia tuberum]|uniref:Uncharacterized protein n=1 Tax=Paraburkholderia tuberum TaxID=157910 RepID=A0A1H1F6J1_9BURK|nr:hypothetical protein SAMN05445850_2291 [Paraburkholderia tuberum]